MNDKPTLCASISKHANICEGGALDGQEFTLTTGSESPIHYRLGRYLIQPDKNHQGQRVWQWQIDPTKKKKPTE